MPTDPVREVALRIVAAIIGNRPTRSLRMEKLWDEDVDIVAALLAEARPDPASIPADVREGAKRISDAIYSHVPNLLNAHTAADMIVRFAEHVAAARVESYALTVDDPKSAHLHYDGCPYKTFSTLPDWEIPDDPPECTCAEVHKGAYWKGQMVLERGAHAITRNALRAQLADSAADLNQALLESGEWQRRAEGLTSQLAGLREALAPIIEKIEAVPDDIVLANVRGEVAMLTVTFGEVRHVRAALASEDH